jgi:hypothetical protein
MALKMRPTGLGRGVYKNAIDYSIFAGLEYRSHLRTPGLFGSINAGRTLSVPRKRRRGFERALKGKHRY